MTEPLDPQKLLDMLFALRAERDAATSALERIERDAMSERSLLEEEQNRFVSRIIDAHDREATRLRLELSESHATVEKLEQKVERLWAELTLARSMLGDALDTASTAPARFASAEPRTATYEPPTPVRQSGIVHRRGPSVRWTAPPAAAAGVLGRHSAKDDPPSSE